MFMSLAMISSNKPVRILSTRTAKAANRTVADANLPTATTKASEAGAKGGAESDEKAGGDQGKGARVSPRRAEQARCQ